MKCRAQKIIFILMVFLVFGGCSAVRVKTTDQANGGRVVEAQKQLCEVPSRLGLYVDNNKNIWLNCPYRYEGRVNDKFDKVSPNEEKNEATSMRFGRDEIRLMRQVDVRPCGLRKYCANLNDYGYANFLIFHKTDSTAEVTYLDLSTFLPDLDNFYNSLDGRKTTFDLKPSLLSLVSASKVIDRISSLGNLEAVENVSNNLKKQGLYQNTMIRIAIDNKLKSPLILVELRLRVLASGTFTEVIGFARKDDREALKRAYDLAISPSEKQQVELLVINNLKNNIFIFKTSLEGTQNVRPSDVNAFIVRLIEARITSRVQYEATLDQQLFKPNYDYVLNAKVNLTAEGKESGERNCGILWMSTCKFDNQDASRTFSQPIKIGLRRLENYKKSGAATIDWKSVSGGSGFASGFIMGGTKVFQATGVSVSISVDSIELVE